MGPLHPVLIASRAKDFVTYEGPTWSARGKSELLTLRALHHVLLGVVGHLEPIIPQVDGFVSGRPSFRVAPTITIMNLLHHRLSFVQPETP